MYKKNRLHFSQTAIVFSSELTISATETFSGPAATTSVIAMMTATVAGGDSTMELGNQ